jgi:hypothetical protein
MPRVSRSVAAATGVDLSRLLWVRCGVEKAGSTGKPWSRIELDMEGLAPEYVSRVPLATWFRNRAAAERTQASILLLTQYPRAKSSGELLL